MKFNSKKVAIAIVIAICSFQFSHAQFLTSESQSECSSTKVSSGLFKQHSFTELVNLQGSIDEGIRIDVSPAKLNSPAAPGDRRLRVGAVEELDVKVDFASLRASQLSAKGMDHAYGMIRSRGSGFDWTGAVSSPEAKGLRLHFTGFYLPRNAELYLSNENGDIVGPYKDHGHDGDGEFWSHTLQGSQITLHLFYDGEDTDRVLGAARFTIAQVGILSDKFRSALSKPKPVEYQSNLCSYNADCIVKADPQTMPASVQLAQDAVAILLYVQGPWIYFCSGGLIADTDPGSNIPLLLTANHCISKPHEASSLEAYFQYVANCDDPYNYPVVLGSSILASGRTGDFTLLQLNELPPSGTIALGWNAGDIASLNGAQLFRISHPSGAPQAYSEHSVDTSAGTCASWPRGEWIYSRDTLGATEGGSSGAPVLNANGEIVGQLSGGCGTNISDVCDAENNATVDGALAGYFDQVEPFLIPNASCTDFDNDGFCLEDGDCNDADATINPGAEELCFDGIDNDCDGAVDDSDPDCQTGSCDLGAKGDFCSVDAECCSNKCRGKQGAKVCRG